MSEPMQEAVPAFVVGSDLAQVWSCGTTLPMTSAAPTDAFLSFSGAPLFVLINMSISCFRRLRGCNARIGPILRTQHQRYHLLSAATLNNSRNRNFVHRKDHGRIEAGIPGSPRPHRRRRTSRSDFGERCSSWLVATAAEDRLIPAQSVTSFAAAWRSMRVSLGWRSHTWRALTSTPASPRTRTPYLSRTVASR